jgi:hypothetical protein
MTAARKRAFRLVGPASAIVRTQGHQEHWDTEMCGSVGNARMPAIIVAIPKFINYPSGFKIFRYVSSWRANTGASAQFLIEFGSRH